MRAPAKKKSADELFATVIRMLQDATEIDFSHYKPPTIRRQLQRRMASQRMTSLADYVAHLKAYPAEIAALGRDVLIHVTRFFRDPASFDRLVKDVFPALLKNHSQNTPLRLWAAACSTGEEPYSLAIALLEHLGDQARSTPIQIFATDVSEHAIAIARAGVYPESIARDVSAAHLRRYFSKVAEGYRITKSVRDLCVFARQDLTRDPPFSRLDLVICRNVMIYLDITFQRKLTSLFEYALKPGGYLMLGGSETLGSRSDTFVLLDKKHKLYRKKQSAGRSTVMNFAHSDTFATAARVDPRTKAASDPRALSVLNETSRLLLARYSPATVLLNNDFHIIHSRGRVGDFLELAPGDASLNILKMVREGLLYPLRSALSEVRKSEAPARREHLSLKYDGKTHAVNLEVIPMASATEGQHFLVVFEKHESASRIAPLPAAPRKHPRGKAAKTPYKDEQSLRRMEQELAASREYLQAIIQDLEAANEELQSANEEILSSNEELQSTNEELDTAKEELQSTNEELNTVNEELQTRNDELVRANSDLINLLASVQIAIVMVSNDLRVRRFTPMAEKLLNLIPSDVGRPISDINPSMHIPDFEKLIKEVIDSVLMREVTVEDKKGRKLTLRIRPYKSIDNRIDGAVVALLETESLAILSKADTKI